ncbi:MAG: hypothetical protein IPG46_19785 [Actinobacteria bacterium]|nr:hypothetical protein [Actinomycetota bacterium]
MTPLVQHDATGAPLDPWGTPITVGCDVAVIATGYGAPLPLTSGVCRVVALGPKRAEVSHPSRNNTYRVHYSTLRVAS